MIVLTGWVVKTVSNGIRGMILCKSSLVALISGIIMSVELAVISWVFFRPTSRLGIARVVSYVSMCRREGMISLATISCKKRMIGLMSSISSWGFIYVRPLAMVADAVTR